MQEVKLVFFNLNRKRMDLTLLDINIKEVIREIFEEEDRLQVAVAQKILNHIDNHIMESGNDKSKIIRLLTLRSSIRKEFERVKGIAI